ncbi:uncharacterized protein TEOVI_000754100 [Trypanosoma equiperdum]|uniref:Uncharacterized protein n=3 Tax=Trypanozoon TaxID=39700 RepID=Q38ES3_TRYB2|nr:hypothetical protein, conserved [Trypanosoma brucei brucei TREU927]EAN76697.1 hypothetical protein, conserved [Trypanosoma brucei brucei TREU927]SCU64431.1 hypothetical protein, conserved [Trypanosoma equiperdum]
MDAGSDEAVQKKMQEFLSKDAMEELRNIGDRTESRVRHGLLPRDYQQQQHQKDYQTANVTHEEEVNSYIQQRRTWRENVFLLRDFEYWRLRAEYYPYVRRGDEQNDNFFIRGIACHPRLSDYPMCRKPIQDYFVCRDKNKILQLFNLCAPMKEQFCACINEVFVKNHERGDKKFNAQRNEYFEEQRNRRLSKMMAHVEDSMEKRKKLQD